MKKTLCILCMLLLTLVAQAQMLHPVKFTSSLKTGKTAEAEIVFTATIRLARLFHRTGTGRTDRGFFPCQQARWCGTGR